LSFYSYIILNRLLANRQKFIFMIPFWTFMVCTIVMRFMILIYRLEAIMSSSEVATATNQQLVNNFHLGYFISIALCELSS